MNGILLLKKFKNLWSVLQLQYLLMIKILKITTIFIFAKK